MTHNNSTAAPAPPGLSAIEEIIVDLKLKFQEEQKRAIDLNRLIEESQVRRDRLTATIESLQGEYGLTIANRAKDSSPIEEISHLETPTSTANQDLSKPESTIEENLGWAKPKNEPWLNLIENAIESKDELLSINEIMNFLGMDEAAKNKHNQTMSGTLAYYRGTDQLVGIPLFRKTGKGRAFALFMTGLPSFFENLQQKRLKPEYEAKFMKKIQHSNLYLSKD